MIEVGNEVYVRADSSVPDRQTKVLMSGDLFAVFDRRGDFRPMGSKEQGLFYKEMRHLSRLVLGLEEDALLLLSSGVRFDNATLAVDLTNAEFPRAEQKKPPGTLHFCRTNSVWENSCYQRMEIRNYGVETVDVELILQFEADFADIFEVRGHRRQKSGRLLEPRVERERVTLGYLGLDGLRRETRCWRARFSPAF
jgi:glycogen debranching enzyme